jgi:hypothetical protein
MRRLRWLIGSLGCLAALAAAPPALATFTPRIAATSDATGGTMLEYTQAASDDPPASLAFFVPSGFLTSVGAHAEGDQIGTVAAKASAADLGGTSLALTGTVNSALATTMLTVAGQQVAVGGAATSCTGSAVHDDYWVLNLSASGQTLQIPVFLDFVLLGRQYSDFAGYVLTMCLPPPDVPSSTPGRASFGAKLLSATLDLDGVFSVPPAWYLWHLLATPYAAGTGKANASATVEAESQDRTPQELSLSAKAAAKRSATVSGRLLQGGKGVGGQSVKILAGKAVVGTAPTDKAGRFSATVKLPGASATLTASAVVPTRDLGGCQQAAFVPAPCTGLTVGGFAATSDPVKVRT